MNDRDPARTRFFLLGLVRFSGVALALLGIAVMTRRWIEPADLVGTILLFAGVIDVVVVPIILVRAWRTPRE